MSIRSAKLSAFSSRCTGRAAVLLAMGFVVGVARAEDPPADSDRATGFQIPKDRRIFDGIRDDEHVLGETESLDEYLSYNEVFQFANPFSAADLEANARRDVSYRDLMGRTRADYKLDLIHLEGKLWRVKRLKATAPLEAVGIPAIYEGWLFPNGETNPVCILFTELPAGLTPALTIEPPLAVRYAGFSFKVIRYESEEKDGTNPARGKMRRAPLLIGKSVSIVPEPTYSPGSDWQGTFVPVLLTGLGAVSAVGFGLAWWFRRGDRAVRARFVERAQQNPFAVV